MNNRNLLWGILVVAVFFVGFMVGRFSSVGDTYITSEGINTNGATQNADNQPGGNATASTTGGTTVDTSNLSDSQRAMLRALGIDTDTLVVTPAMIACAEAEVGVARAEEIKNGATPSFSEGLKLVGCYKQ